MKQFLKIKNLPVMQAGQRNPQTQRPGGLAPSDNNGPAAGKYRRPENTGSQTYATGFPARVLSAGSPVLAAFCTKAILLAVCLMSGVLVVSAQKSVSVASPDGKLKFSLRIVPEAVTYEVTYKKQPVVAASPLGFEFDNGAFGKNLRAGKIGRQRIDETYSLVVGKVSRARNYCNELKVPLIEQTSPGRRIDLVVRAFNDGVAFRYEFPEQDGWNAYVMYDEKTGFRLAGNPTALFMYLPGYVNTHEGVYNEIAYDRIAAKRLIEMPATFRFGNGIFASITEAAVRDYAGMYLMKEGDALQGKLSPRLGQEKIKVEIDRFPHRTPWRVLSVADRVGALLETNILTSLNEPCRIADTSWIKPCRTTFTWWNGNVVPDTTFSPGNNFETNKYYIDFAARHGLDAHGIYGYAETPWYYDDHFNFGWAGPAADVTRPIPCLNMPRIAQYAKSKGVGLHLWVHWRPLYDKLEEAFALYEKWGVKGLMVDFLDRDDQEMIRIQEEILQAAARHRLFIQFHGSSKPSGLIRTYPNEFTREGTLNYEVCKWDTLVNADHDISIPFTRMLAGPADYHLGGFRALPRSEFKVQYVNPHVMSTRCHMLAMYVVLENHLVSLCDTPEAYEGQPGFEVLRTVPGTWDEIRVPLAELNRYVTVARRSGADWWVGTLNNGTARTLQLPLDFLGEGAYRAEIYTDAADATENPNRLDKTVRQVTKNDRLELPLAADGGSVVRLIKQ